MKRILVPTDFSVEADVALDIAGQIATKSKAEIFFLHIIEPLNEYGYNLTGTTGPEVSMDGVFMLKLMDVAKEKTQHRANSSRFIEVTTHAEVIVDDIYDGIEAFVKANHIDLIIMGSKGTNGFQQVLIGSNAEKVIRYANCPVLVVKNENPNFNPTNIILATDGETKTNHVAKFAKTFADIFGAKLHLLNVNTPANFFRTAVMEDKLKAFSKTNNLGDTEINIYNDATEEDGICYFADSINADLVIMGTHQRSAFSRIINGHLSEDVVNHISRPILTLKY